MRQIIRCRAAFIPLFLLVYGPEIRAAEDLFNDGAVLHLQIEISEPNMAILRKTRFTGWPGATGEKRATVTGTVRENGRAFTNVAIHLKGAAGSFRSVDDHPALTINFDKNVKGQAFHGVQRISLNNSVQDRSFISEQLCREMYLAAGIPVPRATEVTVELNGRRLGVYVLTEAFNKQFLKRHFKNPDGNLYDGGFLKDVTDPLEKSSGKKKEDRADLKRLADAAKIPDLKERFTRLKEVLDMDRFISLLALDGMLCNWDGYGINKNNYRIYSDPDSGRIVFMPHGLDQMFGVMRTGPTMPLMPKMNGLVARAVLQTPEGRELYMKRVKELMGKVYDVGSLTNRVRTLTARLQPVLAAAGGNAVQSQRQEADALCNRIRLRADSIRDQLNSPEQSLTFQSDGTVRLAGWKSRTDFGRPAFKQGEDSGKKVLQVTADGSSVGSWVLKVKLEPGRYRLEGKVRCQGVAADPGDRRGGVWLKTATGRPTQPLMGDHGWTNMTFDFELQGATGDMGFMGPIESGVPEVQLVCELRAARGEAWFDLDSLRLVRR